MNKATVVADSKNEFGQRCTTFVCTFPRIVLSEFNTHRMLSRNSASSRAIPTTKMVQQVRENPFIPMRWMKDHSGMQGTEYLDTVQSEIATNDWLRARDKTLEIAGQLYGRQVSKQIINRLLEPFMWHTAIITATEWENFFALRAHKDAEIHIQDLAYKMLDAYNASEPKQLKAGEWHIPLGDQMDSDRLWDLIGNHDPRSERFAGKVQSLMVKIATARCARISYLNFEGKDDYEADIDLFHSLGTRPYTDRKGRLFSVDDPKHMSPFEHCNQAMTETEYGASMRVFYNRKTLTQEVEWGWCGNMRGFIQLRKIIEGENKTDPRVIKK